jgi:ankyrin repeat protein
LLFQILNLYRYATIDNLMNFLLCIEEYNIDLLSINSRNMSGTSALHVAAGFNSMSVLEYLVTEVCVNINASDNWNRTALDEAMRSGHEDVVRCLRAAGARHGGAVQVDDPVDP